MPSHTRVPTLLAALAAAALLAVSATDARADGGTRVAGASAVKITSAGPAVGPRPSLDLGVSTGWEGTSA